MVQTEGGSRIRRIEEENRQMRAALEELTILNDIARAISSAWSLERIMELIVQKCIEHFKAEQGAVTLLDPRDEARPFQTMIRRTNSSENILPYRLDVQLRGWMLEYQKPLLISDIQSDPRFKVNRSKDQHIRSVLSVPLLSKGRMIGSLNVFNKRTDEGFTEADKRLLTIIGTESAQVIENARLHEESQALLLMQEEMRLAYKIQMGLLPQAGPEISGYDIWGKTIPAKEVGGDYYDFVQMGDHELGVCVGDVSGKGMPAALLMATLQATLHSQVLQGLSPKDCLERSNAHLSKRMDPGRFATLFYAVLDGKVHELSYSNAGHNYPFLFKAGKEPTRLGVGGVALGCMHDACYTEERVALAPGDILLLYSDGITEAVSKEVEQFGEERLSNMVIENSEDTAEHLIERIVEAVQLHSGESSQMDDMTAVVVKRKRGI